MNSLLIPLLSCIWIALIPSSTFAQLEPIGPTDGWERISPTVKISGEFEVGIMDMAPTYRSGALSFYVDLVKGDNTKLCVKLTSEDGQYSGDLSYDLARVNPGRVKLEWPTEKTDSLELLQVENMVILAHVSESCEEVVPRTNMRVGSWNEHATSESVVIYLNSSIGTYIEVEGGMSLPCRMTKRGPEITYTYTCACEVPKSALVNTTTVYINEQSLLDEDAEPFTTTIELEVQ